MMKNIFLFAFLFVITESNQSFAQNTVDPRSAYASCQSDIRVLNKNWTDINIKMMAAELEYTAKGTVPSRILTPVKQRMFEYVTAKIGEIDYYSKRAELAYRCPLVVTETTQYLRDGYEKLMQDYPPKN